MHDYAYQPIRRTKSPRSSLSILFFLIVGSISLYLLHKSNTQNFISPVPTDGIAIAAQPTVTTSEVPKDPTILENQIKSIMQNETKNYSVLVDDLNSDFRMTIDEAVIYEAASVNKVPILAALYHKIQNTEIDPEQIITMQQKDKQDYGTGSMRYDPAGTRYSIKTMAKLMMKQSDNTAAYIIANHVVGLKTIQELVGSWGMTQTDMYKNDTSNKDQALLFEKIFKNGIANQGLSDEMRSLMIDSDFENRLPAQLPDGAMVYHKIGTEVGVVHDVGVIKTPKSTYYIGVMLGDLNNEEHAAQLIATISKTVYDFMQ